MRGRARTTDWLIASGLLAAALVEILLLGPAGVRAPDIIGAVVAGAALVWRTSRPTLSAAGVLGTVVLVEVWGPAGYVWSVLAVILSLYSAGRHATATRALGVLVGGLVLDGLIVATEDSTSPAEAVSNFVFVAALMVAGPWGVGVMMSRRDRQTSEATARAVLDERLRMARELHDVVGHSLGVIAVQAGAERATLPDDAPESTRETLTVIERTTHEALAEMRRLVSVMRTDELCDRLRPQPTLAGVDGVLETARRSGWTARLLVEGAPRTVGPGVELTGFRIVQEAVTNAVRHSDGSCLTVTVRYLTGSLELVVADDGTAAGPILGDGFGLAGMRERAALYGGELTTSHADGFVVIASLPYSHRGPGP